MGAPLEAIPQPQDRVRLHIAPFNSELLDKIIAPSVRPQASGISFHTVQTFPERGFGYIELPVMEAQKLKKKLNGSTLKGAKVRVEDAKPEKKRKSDDEAEKGGRNSRKAAKKEKAKAERGVLPGHELEEGRHVKRGWAEGGSARNSTGLEGKKLRFKTITPSNSSPVEATNKVEKKKTSKSKSGNIKVVVDEFGQSTKPIDSPLEVQEANNVDRSDDIDGEVLTEASQSQSKTRRKSSRSTRSNQARVSAIESREVADDVLPPQTAGSSNIEEDKEMDLDHAATEEDGGETPPSTLEQAADIDEVANDAAKQLHPLEALFKRPAKPPLETSKRRPKPIDTSFNFFDADAGGEDDTVGDLAPQTPHTKRDLEWRTLRSAAPTPDTAAIGRRFSLAHGDTDEDEDEDESVEDDQQDQDVEMNDPNENEKAKGPVDGNGRGEESAFRKWFYENRGDFNRGWKKRRRDERKSLRQRENRRLSRKVA